MRSLLPLLLALTPAAAAPQDALERLERWSRDFRRHPEEHVDLAELGRALRHLERSAVAGLLDGNRACDALIRVSAAGLEAREGPWGHLGEQVLDRARSSLARVRSDELVGALATGPLVRRERAPGERAAAALLLAAEASPHAVRGLLLLLRAPEDEVRAAALEALCGRDQDLVHVALADRLDRVGPEEELLLERHFASVRLDPSSRALPPLAQASARRLLGSDWRVATGGLELTRALPDEAGVPLLIQALELWNHRVEDGQPVRRTREDVLAALEQRSGRRIGPRHQRWRTWWQAVREGRIEAGPGEPDASRTSAAFFGLEAVSDRVLFVVDRSGSMGSHIQLDGAAPASRYEEAVEQLTAFLGALGERTRFGIVLFSSGTSAWNLDLAPATGGNVARARSWLLSQGPRGGTHLREGVERALGVDSRGRLDLDRLEADTVIVLCDGGTAEGPGWVEPFLRASARRSRIRFHGIQIGTGGDGTLEALARGTGGDYLVVD